VEMTPSLLRAKDKGKGAVFMSGLLAFLDNHGETPLARAQRGGMDWVEQCGGEISLNYVKTCCRMLQSAGIIEYLRAGKGWTVRLTELGVGWFKSLPDEWGTDVTTPTDGAITEETKAEVEQKPNRRIRAGTRIPTALWRSYVAAQQAGDLDVIFVRAGSVVRVSPPRD